MLVVQGALIQHLAFANQRVAGVRVVTPALAQQVGEQRIADDAFGKRVPIGGFFPLRGQVPVIGDVMVIKDHQARQVRQHSRNAAQTTGERADGLVFLLVARLLLDSQPRWHLWIDQGPGHGRPDQQVHGHHLGKRHQVIIGIAAGEDWLARTAEEALAQGFVALQCRQQVSAVVVAGGVLVERGAVIDHRTLQVFVIQPQTLDQRMDCP
ncbi:hypothetical protein D3C79_725340 [compost metagenome]